MLCRAPGTVWPCGVVGPVCSPAAAAARRVFRLVAVVALFAVLPPRGSTFARCSVLFRSSLFALPVWSVWPVLPSALGAAASRHEDAVLTQALGIGAGYVNVFSGFIFTAIKHGRGYGSGRGDKALGLAGIPVALTQPVRESAHIVIRAAGKPLRR